MPGRSNFASFAVGLLCAVMLALVFGRLTRVGHRETAIGDASAGVYVAGAGERDAGARELAAAEHALTSARTAMVSVLAEHFAAERRRGETMVASAGDVRDDTEGRAGASASANDATDPSMPSPHDGAPAAPVREVATTAPRDVATAARRDVTTDGGDVTATVTREGTAAGDDGVRDRADRVAATAPQLDGEWIVSNAVESTRDARLRGVAFQYRLRLRQERDRIEGRGSRVTKNGKALPRAHQTPVSVTGTLRDGRVELRFAEHGGRGKREGRFTWEPTSNVDLLSGSFASDATGTLGRSEARRVD